MQINKERSQQRTPHGSPEPTARPKRIWLWIFVLIAAFLVIRAVGEKISASREARRTARDSAYPIVRTIHPKISGSQKQLALPGTVLAQEETPIYARTSGYVKRYLVDIGTRVHAGQLLAEIESPEVDQQYNEALGTLQQAQADTNLAWITTLRWKQMLARDTVSRQEADEKQGNFEAQRANLLAAQANVDRLQELKGFEKVYAPFDGVITRRNVNLGDLITANDTSQHPMFSMADDRKLFIYVNVPESNAASIKLGEVAKVALASAPGVTIEGKVRSIASAIDPHSRTMLTQVVIDNSDHTLLSGGYATVIFDLKLAQPSLVLPVNALLFRPEGTMVGVVGTDGRVSLRMIQIGKDYGTYVEVVSGISTKDNIILDPSDSLQQGDYVRLQGKSQ